VDVGRYFCYLATVYLHGVGPVWDLGVHGPVQRDKLLSVEPVHDNNDKAVIHQGSGPNLKRKQDDKNDTATYFLCSARNICTIATKLSSSAIMKYENTINRHSANASTCCYLSNQLNLLAIYIKILCPVDFAY